MSDTYKSIVDEILKSQPDQAGETSAGQNTPAQPEPQPQPVPQVEPSPEPQPEPQNPEGSQTPKEWYEEEDTNPEPNPVDQNTQTQTQTQAPTPVQEEEDEDIQLIKEFKKQGKSLKDFVKEYNVVDYNSMDDKKSVERGLRELEGFSGEELEDASAEIETMSLFQKKKLVQEYRAKFNQINEEKLKKLSSVEIKQNDMQEKIVHRFNTELESTVKNIENQERYGLKITDEMSKSLRKYVAEEMNFQRPDGSLDVEALLDVAIWRKYGKDIVRANVTRAKNEGREEILRQTTNPSTGMNPSNATAGMSNGNFEDEFNNYLKNKR